MQNRLKKGKAKKKKGVSQKSYGGDGYFVLVIWLVTLAFIAIVGIPVARARANGRCFPVDLTLILVVLSLTAGSLYLTYRWVRERFGV